MLVQVRKCFRSFFSFPTFSLSALQRVLFTHNSLDEIVKTHTSAPAEDDGHFSILHHLRTETKKKMVWTPHHSCLCFLFIIFIHSQTRMEAEVDSSSVTSSFYDIFILKTVIFRFVFQSNHPKSGHETCQAHFTIFAE